MISANGIYTAVKNQIFHVVNFFHSRDIKMLRIVSCYIKSPSCECRALYFSFLSFSRVGRELIIKQERKRFYGRITRESPSYSLISVEINDTHSLLELLFNGRLSHFLARDRVKRGHSPERTREIMRLRHCESFREMGRASSRETFAE